MCSQGELQCHQTAADRPVPGPDEETEEHTGRGLLHVLHEATTQVAVDMLIVVGVIATL